MKERNPAIKSTNVNIPVPGNSDNTPPGEVVNSPQVLFRYSDQDLEEFKVLVSARLETAKEELRFFTEQLKGKEDMDGETTRLNLEDGSTAREIEHCGQLAARQIQFIKNLENAMVRINNKTYGICRVTGKLIDKARLRIVPHATLSMEAKTK